MRKSGFLLMTAAALVLLVAVSIALASTSKESRRLPSNAATSRPYARTGRPHAAHKVKILGYKHSPEEIAKARMAQARAYLRRADTRSADRLLDRAFSAVRPERDHRSAGDAGEISAASAQLTIGQALAPLASIGGDEGADPGAAAETAVGQARDPVWLVPGSSGMCLVNMERSQNTGAACNDSADVMQGKLWTLDTMPYGPGGLSEQVLLGAAPDGDSLVTVNWSDGSSTVVPVINNIYSVAIGTHTGWTSVAMNDAAGSAVNVPGLAKLP